MDTTFRIFFNLQLNDIANLNFSFFQGKTFKYVEDKLNNLVTKVIDVRLTTNTEKAE